MGFTIQLTAFYEPQPHWASPILPAFSLYHDVGLRLQQAVDPTDPCIFKNKWLATQLNPARDGCNL
jgi:hypothetical protein